LTAKDDLIYVGDTIEMRDERSSLFGRPVDLVEKPAGSTPIEAVRHWDTRVNIPTEELRDPTLDP
jgi:hypothetical protein